MTQALRKPRGALAIDMMVESDRWRQSGDAAALARAAVIEAAAALSTARAELAIVLTDDFGNARAQPHLAGRRQGDERALVPDEARG